MRNLIVMTAISGALYAAGAHAQADYPAKPIRIVIGSGSPTHLGMELFKISAQIDLVHIPYKGAAPSRIDLLGGHVDVILAQ